ncbi:hypothetical protein [uncultured Muribaculum sp.]|uniref:hypothetical protein n=1 Tax=uncultured Muribaculum sp. TaxID=1918613 RepID=UPI002597E5F5|nr:hypothetical protein [uncultured Muribaculum sp.]
MKAHTKFHRLHCILHFSLEALTLATAIATLCEVEKHHRQAKEAHKERRHLL